jgi:hypothetical protein
MAVVTVLGAKPSGYRYKAENRTAYHPQSELHGHDASQRRAACALALAHRSGVPRLPILKSS